MKYYIGREADLEYRVNSYLKKLTNTEKDYVSELKIDDYLELKSALTNINNVLTLKMTFLAIDWLSKYFKLVTTEKEKIKAVINEIKPNSNGYDIYITAPIKLIAEVKCINPFNNGNKYGAAQWHGILNDAVKLKTGKRQLSDTLGFYKFLFLADFGERTNTAIDELLRRSKSRGTNKSNIEKHAIKNDLDLFSDQDEIKNLSTKKIYIKTLKLK